MEHDFEKLTVMLWLQNDDNDQNFNAALTANHNLYLNLRGQVSFLVKPREVICIESK